ncbi:hypothetical protein [Pseudoalteromonas sp. SG44-8]|uniref:hypothetical protein n=1 Tax=Pseudoalteromonas sp. SG44-8 TaxID=2760958 RepID=UPI0016015D01|nr:hypothetical protein [Pseudoalteromonas sp. SG44-8]MBB1398760.1 hypothetical protein [Pseudoalteromonas sp. SG44-8]
MSDDAIQLATKLLESDEDYLDNVIGLWRIGNRKYEQCWDTEFHVFGVIESDTDHLPLKHVRANCSSEFLAKSDKELAEIIEHYKAEVVSACNKIVSSKNV